MTDVVVECSFVDVAPSAGDMLARNLSDYLATDVGQAEISRKRSDPRNQDFGATVVIILGTPAMISIARGISKWIARNRDVKITMTRTNKEGSTQEITVDGHAGSRVEEIVRGFLTVDS
jgi:hypothetical protein